ncbi:7tm 7 domain containing protein, partial [Asbolus verrucosus]
LWFVICNDHVFFGNDTNLFKIHLQINGNSPVFVRTFVDKVFRICPTVVVCPIILNRQIKLLLIKVQNIKLYSFTSPNKHVKRNIWCPIMLFGSLLLNLMFMPFMGAKTKLFVYIWFPRFVNASDTLFLRDILYYISDKFELINLQLQRQICSVDLFKLFPLTTTNKIKLLEEDDINFNIQRIEELSHMHYNLINLATEIVKLFEITVILSLILWFESIIETVYYIIYMTVNELDQDLIHYGLNVTYVMFLFCWLFVLVSSFSHTQNKANRTATYVHDIWNKYAVSGKVDRRVRHLQLTSIRLLNTKLQFTAMDFFNLDWTLCHTIIAAVTTYVVILIQFYI